MTNSTTPILNPTVYLNYLLPDVANEYEIARNVFLVTFGVECMYLPEMMADLLLQALLWDILSSLPNDWKLIRTDKFTPVLFAYFLSR